MIISQYMRATTILVMMALGACAQSSAVAPVAVAPVVVPPVPIKAPDPIDDSNVCYDEARKGDPKVAIDYCTRAINAGVLNEADVVAALLNRGVAHKRDGHFNLAIADYTRALELAPGDAMALTNRANASREVGLMDSALMDVNAAIQTEPDYAAAYYVRGSIYETLRQPDRAQADFNRAHELAPQHEDYRAKSTQLVSPETGTVAP